MSYNCGGKGTAACLVDLALISASFGILRFRRVEYGGKQALFLARFAF